MTMHKFISLVCLFVFPAIVVAPSLVNELSGLGSKIKGRNDVGSVLKSTNKP